MGFLREIERLIGIEIKEVDVTEGILRLKHGKHEVFVELEYHPTKVLISKKDKGFDGCCNAPVNKLSWEIQHNGILFTVEVNTDKCTIEWMAVRESC